MLVHQLLLLLPWRQSGEFLLQGLVTAQLGVVQLALALGLVEVAALELQALRGCEGRVGELLDLALAQQQFVLVLLALEELAFDASRRGLSSHRSGQQATRNHKDAGHG